MNRGPLLPDPLQGLQQELSVPSASVKWIYIFQQWPRAPTPHHKPLLLQDKETRWRKRRQAKGMWRDNLSAVMEECVVVLWCECEKSSLHCTCSRGSVCPRATLYWQTIPSHSEWDTICWPVQWSYTVLLIVFFSSILGMFSNFETWKMAMMRSINLAMTNCLENKYINIYIRKIYIFVLRENVSKIKWCFYFNWDDWWMGIFFSSFFRWLFSYEMLFWVYCCFFFLIEYRLFTLKYKENSLETLD